MVRFRYLGLAASVLLVVVGWLGGALPHGDLHSTPVSIAEGRYGPFILCGWAVGTGLWAYAWWSLRGFAMSARWAVSTVALWVVPFLFAAPSGSRDVYSYACQGYLFVHGLSPYSHGVVALPCPWLAGVPPIWRDTTAPYGPLFVLISGGTVHVAGESFSVAVVLFRLIAVLSVAAAAVSIPVLARRCGVEPGRALWIGLGGPLIAPHLIGGPHNDALMVGLLMAGLAAAAWVAAPSLSRPFAGTAFGARPVAEPASGVEVVAGLASEAGSVAESGSGVEAVAEPVFGAGSVAEPVFGVTVIGGVGGGADVGPARRLGGILLAGVLLGLAVAVKVTAVVVVPFALLLVLSRPYRVSAVLRDGGLLVASAAGAMAGITAVSGLGFGWMRAMLSTKDLVQFTSPPTAVGMTITYLGRLVDDRFDAVPAVRVLATALFVVIFGLLWWRAARSDAPIVSALRGAGYALAAMVALSPYFHPWYATWPLLVLAATTTRTRLIAAVSIVTALLVLPDGGGLARFVKFPGAPIVTVILAVLLYRGLPGLRLHPARSIKDA